MSCVRSERLIHKVLAQQKTRYGDRQFVFFKEKWYGYKDFDMVSDRVARGLQNIGVSKQDKVAIMAPNCVEFLFLWFGLSKIGAVEVPINTAHKGALLHYMLQQSNSSLLVIHNQYIDRIKPLLGSLSGIKALVVLEMEAEEELSTNTLVLPWEQLIDNDGRYMPVDVSWEDPFCILYTSGTTGPSKGVLLPHNYALCMGELCIETMGYTEEDRLYNALPLFHGNAQLLSFMPALISGATTVLADRFSASRFWDDVRTYGCTEFNSLGSIVPILFKAEEKPDDAANPLRAIMAAATPKDIHEAFEKRFGLKIVEVYGMTEFGLPIMSDLNDRRSGACGKPRYAEVKLVDNDLNTLGPNEVGELLVRPAKHFCMLLEYYNMPEKTVEAWRDLWFHSGDYFRFDEEGYFYFVDRKKDALRRRGENISSYEVEKVVASHPDVLESAAVAVKSPMGEDDVMICVVVQPGRSLGARDLISYCEENMAYFMVPRYVRFLDMLPKTPTERVQKHILRETGITNDTWDREAAGYEVKR